MKILKNSKLRVLMVCLTAMVFVACEEELPSDYELRDEYTGTWTCNESSTLYGNSTYSVSIVNSSTGIGFIKIKNFYNEGSVCDPDVEVFDNSLTLANQSVTGNSGSFSFQGSGTSTTDYSSFSLSFTANDGGSTDDVTANFSR